MLENSKLKTLKDKHLAEAAEAEAKEDTKPTEKVVKTKKSK